jgi:2-oxoglutarate dehydrogenase E2 component (dihydrolipoamide succinyltransferase)
VAIDLGQGLKVVTLTEAEKLGAEGISRRLAELTLDYMETRLAPADVQGATFTVTDLSAFDVLQFEPLMNGRQCAILGLGGDSTLPGHPMSLTLAFDHRVLSGREVGTFLRALRDRLLALAPRGVEPTEPAPPACCDRCLIEVAEYYRKFPAVGVMHHYLRPDGTTGLICHACLATI